MLLRKDKLALCKERWAGLVVTEAVRLWVPKSQRSTKCGRPAKGWVSWAVRWGGVNVLAPWLELWADGFDPS